MDIFLAQVNPCIADLKGNTQIILNTILEANQANADVVLLPEMVTTAYPPRDYLYNDAIWENQRVIAHKVLDTLRGLPRQMTVIYGGLHEVELTYGKRARYNAAYIVDPIEGIRVVHKRLLPCYDVFDETRYFAPGEREVLPVVIHVQGKHGIYSQECDVLICEDCWNYKRKSNVTRMSPVAYDYDPVSEMKGDGPVFILNGSPFWWGKVKTTINLVETIANGTKRPVCWVNQIGAHDDIITGGYSMVSVPIELNSYAATTQKRVITRIAKAFAEDRMLVRLEDCQTKMSYLFPGEAGSPTENEARLGLQMPTFHGKKLEEADFEQWCVYQALRLGIVDYCRRARKGKGFSKVALGLSGGIDSAVVAAIAADALQPASVTGIGLPSKYSSEGSLTDAVSLAKSLGINWKVISIARAHEVVRDEFLSGGQQEFNNSVTDENIQPRLRGLFLMAHCNDNDTLLLTTGNKSEISVGYCTLYGDMCGMLAVISDCYKSINVYPIAKLINKYRPGTIPESTITKPPSAELRPDQKDTDSLPPYEVLDPILYELVENELTPEEVVAKFNGQEKFVAAAVVPRVDGMLCGSEFKRQQMAPGFKVQKRSFGSGRRYPITAKFSLAV